MEMDCNLKKLGQRFQVLLLELNNVSPPSRIHFICVCIFYVLRAILSQTSHSIVPLMINFHVKIVYFVNKVTA